MTRQNLAYKVELDDFISKPPNLESSVVSGIKLRDSLFVVYSCKDSVSGSEFVYNLKSLTGDGDMIFDISMNSEAVGGGAENCGVYRLEDGRILNISKMKDWHFEGHVFKDEKEWVQYSEFADRNSVDR